VQRQAIAQQDEHVASHQEASQKLRQEQNYYSEKLKFYSLLLVLLVLSYLAVRALPLFTGQQEDPL
jgi:hypothetical protein